MNRLSLAGEEGYVVLKNKAELFGVAIGILTFQPLFKCRRVLLVTVRTYERIAP